MQTGDSSLLPLWLHVRKFKICRAPLHFILALTTHSLTHAHRVQRFETHTFTWLLKPCQRHKENWLRILWRRPGCHGWKAGWASAEAVSTQRHTHAPWHTGIPHCGVFGCVTSWNLCVLKEVSESLLGQSDYTSKTSAFCVFMSVCVEHFFCRAQLNGSLRDQRAIHPRGEGAARACLCCSVQSKWDKWQFPWLTSSIVADYHCFLKGLRHLDPFDWANWELGSKITGLTSTNISTVTVLWQDGPVVRAAF